MFPLKKKKEKKKERKNDHIVTQSDVENKKIFFDHQENI